MYEYVSNAGHAAGVVVLTTCTSTSDENVDDLLRNIDSVPGRQCRGSHEGKGGESRVIRSTEGVLY